MSILDLTGGLVVVLLMVFRFGVPLLGIWLLGEGLKRAVPATP